MGGTGIPSGAVRREDPNCPGPEGVKETVYHLDHQGLRIVGLNSEALRNDEEGLAHPTLAAGDGSRQRRRRRVWRNKGISPIRPYDGQEVCSRRSPSTQPLNSPPPSQERRAPSFKPTPHV
ncbi:MAG: hypothetical protein BRD35_05255 [Bacteroidetes bacterium QH_7_62_13]|nr:MAG: hypothetical protein BRD35_05255 [Bacteroidetes bacterium QH_7_62_13]